METDRNDLQRAGIYPRLDQVDQRAGKAIAYGLTCCSAEDGRLAPMALLGRLTSVLVDGFLMQASEKPSYQRTSVAGRRMTM